MTSAAIIGSDNTVAMRGQMPLWRGALRKSHAGGHDAFFTARAWAWSPSCCS